MGILRRLSIDVDFARDQTCCGQPQFNAGLRKDARAIAEYTIKVFESTTGDIVTPSGSCTHMFRHNYPELFEGFRARRLYQKEYMNSQNILLIN